MRVAPVDVGKTQVQITQRATDRHVGQAEMNAAAKRFVAQAGAHGLERGADFSHLAINPGLAALRSAAAGPGGFQPGQNGRVHQAVGQGFPGFHFGAFAALRGDELADGRQRVEVFTNCSKNAAAVAEPAPAALDVFDKSA